jgi:hypothetical protein
LRFGKAEEDFTAKRRRSAKEIRGTDGLILVFALLATLAVKILSSISRRQKYLRE